MRAAFREGNDMINHHIEPLPQFSAPGINLRDTETGKRRAPFLSTSPGAVRGIFFEVRTAIHSTGRTARFRVCPPILDAGLAVIFKMRRVTPAACLPRFFKVRESPQARVFVSFFACQRHEEEPRTVAGRCRRKSAGGGTKLYPLVSFYSFRSDKRVLLKHPP
jgi:hypothetical protein